MPHCPLLARECQASPATTFALIALPPNIGEPSSRAGMKKKMSFVACKVESQAERGSDTPPGLWEAKELAQAVVRTCSGPNVTRPPAFYQRAFPHQPPCAQRCAGQTGSRRGWLQPALVLQEPTDDSAASQAPMQTCSTLSGRLASQTQLIPRRPTPRLSTQRLSSPSMPPSINQRIPADLQAPRCLHRA